MSKTSAPFMALCFDKLRRNVHRNAQRACLFALTAMLVVTSAGLLAGCSRSTSAEVAAARSLADAVTRNEAGRRDSLIATSKFREYFTNVYVGHDMARWFQSFYDFRTGHFMTEPTTDANEQMEKALDGALIDTNKIEETGMVKVKSPVAGEEAAYFWMVKQHGLPWRVAIVTKGESQVNFH